MPEKDTPANLVRAAEGLPSYDLVHIVSHPAHYTSGRIEVWDFIRDQGLNYHRGNVIKYVSRAGKKDPSKEIEDLEKAKAYLQSEIDFLRGVDDDAEES